MAELEVVLSARNQAQGALSSFGNQLQTLEKQVGGLKQSLASAGQSLQGFGAKMSIGVTAPLTGMGVMAVSAASDLEESLSKVGAVFDENAGQIEAWSQTAATSLGVSQQQALEAAGTFGNLFDAMGIGDAATVEMSTGLVQLASDLASFNNLDPTEALEKLRAGIVGETEPLRTLGVNLSAAATEMKALEMTGKDSAKALTEQEKVAARYALIMEQTANSQGDFARTSAGLANSQRILTAQVQDAAASLGQLLLPYALQMVGAISQLVTWVQSLSPEMQQFAVIGAAVAAAIGPLAGVLGTVLTVLSALISPIGLVVAAVGLLGAAWATNFMGIQDATAGAVAAVQEALAGLPAFVQGVLPGMQASLQEGMSGVQSIMAQAGEFLAPAVENVNSAFGDMVAGFGELGPEVGALGEAFGNLATALQPVAEVIGQVLVVAFDLLLNTVSELMRAMPEVIGNAITIMTDMINLLATNITNAIALIKAVLSGDWQAAWKIASQIVTDNLGFVQSTFETMSSTITTLLSALATAVTQTFGDIASFLGGLNLPNPFAGLMGFIDSTQARLQEFQSWLGGFSLPSISWPSLPTGIGWPNNAIGSLSFGGGLTMVGETGPELVMLPRGSRIYGAQETAQMSGGGGVNVTIEQAVIRSEQDIYELAYRIREVGRREGWNR